MSRLFIISAPSGAGKTSLVNAVLAKNKNYPIERVVTYTTRQPRSTELQGIDYHFIPEQEFAYKIEQNYFLDWQRYNNTYYGMAATVIEKLTNGIAQIAILDRAGAQHVASKVPSAVLIWVNTPVTILRQRLVQRNTETNEQIERRLALAIEELDAEMRQPFYGYQLVNESFDQAVLDFESILIKELKKEFFLS